MFHKLPVNTSSCVFGFGNVINLTPNILSEYLKSALHVPQAHLHTIVRILNKTAMFTLRNYCCQVVACEHKMADINKRFSAEVNELLCHWLKIS